MAAGEPVPGAELFLSAARTMVKALAHPTVSERWHEPSALAGHTIGSLGAHTARSIRTVLMYLDGPEPEGALASPAAYFLNGLGDEDPIDSDLHRSIRHRAVEAARAGPAQLLQSASADLATLTNRLTISPPRTVEVFGGTAMALSDYLVTRLVEIVVRLDDLAYSIWRRVAGPTAMLRALSRAERVADFPRAF